MKDSMDATAVGRAVDPEVFANRKLIRPALNRNDHARPEGERRSSDRGDRADRGADRSNGKEIHGVIEWYDKYCLKVNRIGATNLLIYKPSIKYMYKESESTPSPSPRK
jgi:hypothetical protein